MSTRIIDKIRKCLALSKSSNPHEAAAALRQAQGLMRMHGLTAEAVELAEVKEASHAVAASGMPRWDARLAGLVADTFGCRLIVSEWRVGPRARESSWVFIGVAAASEVARYAYEVLARQCWAQRATHIAGLPRACKRRIKTDRGDAFAIAWVEAVAPMLERFAGREQDAELLDRYMEQRHGKLEEAKPSRRAAAAVTSYASMTEGYAAGKNASLARGVGSAGQPLAIGGGS